jgi:hypothetical protein
MSIDLSDMSNQQPSLGSEVSDGAAASLYSDYEEDVPTKAGDKRLAVRRSWKECSNCSSKDSRFCSKNLKNTEPNKDSVVWTTVLELFPWVVGLIWVFMQLTGAS